MLMGREEAKRLDKVLNLFKAKNHIKYAEINTIFNGLYTDELHLNKTLKQLIALDFIEFSLIAGGLYSVRPKGEQFEGFENEFNAKLEKEKDEKQNKRERKINMYGGIIITLIAVLAFIISHDLRELLSKLFHL